MIWVESLINIGCKFGPGDLPPDTWDQLLALNLERAFLDRVIQRRREQKHEREHEEQQLDRAAQRAGSTLPPRGGTIFKPSKPFR